ncbi:MAG: hypothetical protein ACLFPF_07805 [Halanaerobiales bacterium]
MKIDRLLEKIKAILPEDEGDLEELHSHLSIDFSLVVEKGKLNIKNWW